jgi:hypothetical protein
MQAQENGSLDASLTEVTGAELFQLIVDEAEAKNKDIAYKPNSNRTALVPEVEGRSSLTINSNGPADIYQLANMTGSIIGNQSTSTAELINEGQILVYPYNILTTIQENDNTMEISETHGQYFQIDMNEDLDNDGESDITVWLALKGDSGKLDQYNAAERDARNNYYIYTKGNVTYSGVGHSNLNYSTNETEIKLYINTMVAAYNAGAHAPEITLKQTADTDSDNLKVLYVGMDSSVENGIVKDGELVDKNGTERIYYTVDDTNIVLGTKQISVEYYLVFEKESDVPDSLKDQVVRLQMSSDSTAVYAVKQNWSTYRENSAIQEASLDNMTSGVVYACDVPCNILDMVKKNDADMPGEATVWIVATTSIWKQNNNVANAPSGTYTSYKTFKVQRVGLFDLD